MTEPPSLTVYRVSWRRSRVQWGASDVILSTSVARRHLVGQLHCGVENLTMPARRCVCNCIGRATTVDKVPRQVRRDNFRPISAFTVHSLFCVEQPYNMATWFYARFNYVAAFHVYGTRSKFCDRNISGHRCRFSLQSRTRTVVRERFKGDEASQWKRPKFDPSPHQNPLTDLHKNWQA